jgi:eukaryotic-like serine/threonine-protein kinase
MLVEAASGFSVKADDSTSGATVDERGGGKPRELSGTKLSRGTNLGRYVLLDPIGEGGLGVVYAAYDPELDRKVAIKLLRPRASRSTTATEGKTRLLREAQAMARLSHPNVVAVHDVGVHEDQVFIAMDLIEGETLTRWMARKRSAREVLGVFLQAGRGLAAAHAAGLVHRDFKPDNVLIAKDGRALVTDFGLARAAGFLGDLPELPASPVAQTELGHDSGPLATPLTAAGIVMGTPGYVAPEQLRGEPADALSDQFSFCVSLYEALYGERPFAGNTLDGYAAAIEQSGAYPRSATGRVPSRLRRILLKGMSLKPADRFPSVDALLAELSKDPARTTRRMVSGAGVVLACAAALFAARQYGQRRLLECEGSATQLAGVWDATVRARMHRVFTATGKPFAEDAWTGVLRVVDPYAASWAAKRDEACLSTYVRKEQTEEVLLLRMACFERERTALKALVDVLGNADASIVENAVVAAQSLPGTRDCANAAMLRGQPIPISADPASAARVVKMRGRIAEATALYDAGQFAKAITVAGAVAAECDAPGDRSLRAEALFTQGRSQRESLDYQSAFRTFSEAYLAATSSLNQIVSVRAASWAVDATAYLGKYDDARFWFRLAQAGIDAIGQTDELEAELLLNHGNACGYRGEYGEAAADQRLSLDLAIRTFGPDDHRTNDALNNLAVNLVAQGDWQRGMELYGQGIKSTERSLGPKHPNLSLFLGNYGEALSALGRPGEGLQACERALTIACETTGPESGIAANALVCLARSARYLSHLDEAYAFAEKIVAIYKNGQKSDWEMLPSGLDELGLVWLAKGRPKEALGVLEESIAKREKTRGPESAELQDALDGAGNAYLQLHQAAKAIPLLERAVRLRQKGLAEPGQLGATLFALARARSEAKDDPKFARELAVQAREDLGKYPWWASTLQQVDAWLKAHPGR